VIPKGGVDQPLVQIIQLPLARILLAAADKMSGPMANSNVADLSWETWRDTIRTLYLVEDHSLEEVMNEMTTKYQFTAT
jgi:hypothetical protein